MTTLHASAAAAPPSARMDTKKEPPLPCVGLQLSVNDEALLAFGLIILRLHLLQTLAVTASLGMRSEKSLFLLGQFAKLREKILALCAETHAAVAIDAILQLLNSFILFHAVQFLS